MLRDYFSQDIFTVLVIISLLLIVTVRQLFSIRFIDYLDVIWNVRYLKIYSRDRKKIDVYNIILFTNFLIVISLFAFLSYTHFSATSPIENWYIGYLVFGFGAFLVLKSIVEKLIGLCFEVSEMIELYIFQKLTYANYSGLILLIFNILLLFNEFDKKLLIYTGFIVFALINLAGFVRIVRLYQNVIIAHFFYFLLYLCALEIGPYIILYKAIKDYFG